MEKNKNQLQKESTKTKSLGITQEYNKENRDRLWDSTKSKSDFKNNVFSDKQTYNDPISGKLLHKNQKPAQNKYHMKNSNGQNISSKWASHTAETDHINALKDTHNYVKHNPFLTDEDFKEVMNSKDNYRILSKTNNTSKGDKNDWQYILDKNNNLPTNGKLQIAKEKIRADISIHGQFTARTVKNASKEFATGATDALIHSTIPLTVEAVNRMIKVAQGEENIEDALKEMGKETLKVAVVGGGNELIIDVTTKQMTNSQIALLRNIATSNAVTQIVGVALVVQESAIKYINGEIDGQTFIEEVEQKGTIMVAGMIGGRVGSEIGGIIGGILGTVSLPGLGTVAGHAAGRVVGEILGTIIATVACGLIVTAKDVLKHMDNYKLKEQKIKSLEREAIREIERQRLEFRKIVEREYKKWDNTIQDGFNQILRCACEEAYDIQGVTEGLEKILSIFGKHVAFNNLEEYEKQLNLPLKLTF